MAESVEPRLSGRIAFTYPDFVLYQAARFFIVAALEMQSVAVGWQVYEITKRPLDLGLIGLAQFLPGMLLFLVSGHVADRFDRRRVVTLCYCGFALCSGLLWAIVGQARHSVHLIYGVVVLIGVVRAFNAPVSRALLPQLVREELNVAGDVNVFGMQTYFEIANREAFKANMDANPMTAEDEESLAGFGL